MDKITKLAIVGGVSGYTRVLCEAPSNADVEPGDSVIYERNDTQAVGTVINAIELTGAQGRALADFIADWLDITRPFMRIVGAVQMFDWSSEDATEAVDDTRDDGDDGDADESADAAEPEPAPERDQGADAANSMDTGGANFNAVGWHHAKPRTLEDVLAEYRLEADRLFCDPSIGGEDRADALESLDARYAAEIRELMEVD